MTVLSNIITPSNVLTTTNTATVTNKTLTSPTVTGMTVSDGTANGVTYLNGSKVLTSGSALTFDGTNFGGAVNVLVSDNKAIGFGSNAYWLGNSASGFIAGYINGSEGLRLTSTGLGIGTSSPSFKVDARASAGVGIQFLETSSGSSNRIQLGAGGGLGYINADAGSGTIALALQVGGSTKATLDGSGNLGLGVTPSAWNTSNKAFQFSSSGVLFGETGNTYLGSNIFVNSAGDNRYITTNFASMYRQVDGKHLWYTAASGTAGNSITFTQAMTLGSDGNLAVGTTSTSGARLKVDGGDTAGTIGQFGNAQGGVILGAASSVAYVDTTSSTPLAFRINGTERARIDSSGNLLVGTTSAGAGWGAGGKLTVDMGTSFAVLKSANGTGSPPLLCWSATNTTDNLFISFATETGGSVRGTIDYNRAGGLTRYNTTSDYRAKDISGPVTGSGALIDSIPVYMGKMKWATEERPMFIAHEVPAYAHTGTKDEVDADGKPVYQQMDASALIPVMWAEIQSLRQRLSAANL